MLIRRNGHGGFVMKPISRSSRMTIPATLLLLACVGCNQSFVHDPRLPAPEIPSPRPPRVVATRTATVPTWKPTLPAIPSAPKPAPPRATFAWKPPSSERPWKYIVIHHSASPGGSHDTIHAAHSRKRTASGERWLGIGYHFVIGNGSSGQGDGEIQASFRWMDQIHGAHAGENTGQYNSLGIGICIIGELHKRPPSAAQVAAAVELVEQLRRRYSISRDRVLPHSAVRRGGTVCPGGFCPLERIKGP